MHFYSFNIGDYMSHTVHLSLMEDLAYRRCLDIYYLHEKPLPEDATEVARLIRMPEHKPEVVQVLKEFFTHDVGTGYVHKRTNEEITKYQAKIQAASRAGKASALARSNASSTKVQPNNKQETLNKKQETNIKRPRNVSKKTWNDFLTHRKNKKAPLTETALIGIKNEVKKTTISLEDALVMCQARGWQSFKSDWIKEEQKSFATTNYGEGVQKI
tara:strand:- start:472 stop:1116 length:645 start_codon:yes stop_codon:yes gene_type:complete